MLRSYQDKDDWNAIDPNAVIQDEKNVWLASGSFWGGIKMRRIDPATGKLSSTDPTLYSLSSRPREPLRWVRRFGADSVEQVIQCRLGQGHRSCLLVGL